MLEPTIRSYPRLTCAIIALGSAATLLCSCATEEKRTVLIDDPDAHRESSIPWNKPAKWENGANLPGGLGGTGGGVSGVPPGQ